MGVLLTYSCSCVSSAWHQGLIYELNKNHFAYTGPIHLFLFKSLPTMLIRFVNLNFRLMVTFVNSLDPDQARHLVGPDLVSNCLTL